MSEHVLEPAAQAFADATANPPFVYELGVEGARKLLDDVQSAPVEKPDIDEKWITVPAEVGDVRVRIVKPVGAAAPGGTAGATPDLLPTILYVHGGGWILGGTTTHDRLVRDLAVGVGAAVVFVEYTRRRSTRWRSSRPTPPRSGSPATARPRAWTRPGWPWPATPWAAT
jgi:acetyl esterase/lipase